MGKWRRGSLIVVVVVIVDGVRGERTPYGEISGVWGGLVWVWGDGEDETEGVLSVEVETIEAFLADEAEGLVEGEGGDVVELGFEDDLGGSEIDGGGAGRRTSVTPFRFMTSIERRTRVLARVVGKGVGGTWGGAHRRRVCASSC